MITLIINSNTYRIDPADMDTVITIAAPDKLQLIDLLSAINQHDQQIKIKAQVLLKQAGQVSTINKNKAAASVDSPTPKLERLRPGDADALIARLAMEEANQQKTGLTKDSIYKFVGGLAVLIILLIIIL
jgi:hypothetical protein